jgi:magnesium transporter
VNEGRLEGGPLQAAELRDAWRVLDVEERVDGFRLLPPADAEEFFLAMTTRDQMELVRALTPAERRSVDPPLAPDDAADVLQEAPRGGARASCSSCSTEPRPGAR